MHSAGFRCCSVTEIDKSRKRRAALPRSEREVPCLEARWIRRNWFRVTVFSPSDETRLISLSLHIPISAYDGAHGTGSDDVGRLQRDRRAAATGDPGPAAGG